MTRFIRCLMVSVCAVYGVSSIEHARDAGDPRMRLGNFSISLTVKDLAASRAFYEKLGFRASHGDGKRWQIMQSGTTKVGLFQGLFKKNMLTFNPGWDSDGKPVADFDDIREIQKELKKQGITLTTEADAGSTGPASFTLSDPDGNPILFDQFVARPESRK